MNPIHILFLDFDGVIRTRQGDLYWKEHGVSRNPGDEFCPVAIANLNSLCRHLPDLKIIFSTSSRHGNELSWLAQHLALNGFHYPERCIGKTPELNEVKPKTRFYERWQEIEAWLDENALPLNVDSYLILDDFVAMGPWTNTAHFICCDDRVGFDYLALEKALRSFGYDQLPYYL